MYPKHSSEIDGHMSIGIMAAKMIPSVSNFQEEKWPDNVQGRLMVQYTDPDKTTFSGANITGTRTE